MFAISQQRISVTDVYIITYGNSFKMLLDIKWQSLGHETERLENSVEN